MGVTKLIKNLLFKSEFEINPKYYREEEKIFNVKTYALFTVIDFVATMMAQIEFYTYLNGEKIKGLEYHRLNIKPNSNYNAADFWHEFWTKLLFDREVLVIEANDQLIIADSFSHHPEYAIREDIFENVSRGDFVFNKKFKSSEVFYIRYGSDDISNAVNGVMDLYSKLVNHSEKIYKNSGGEKGILSVNSAATGPEDFEKRYGAWINRRFREYYRSNSAVMPLFRGMTYTSRFVEGSSDAVTDIRSVLNEALNDYCNAYKLPFVLLRGEVAGIDEAVKLMMTACIDPLARKLEKEINAKEFTPEEYARGNYVKAFTGKIKHIDVLESAPNFDKLFADGWSHNDLLELVDRAKIPEEWADRHYVTKNYENVETVEEMGEGEENGEG